MDEEKQDICSLYVCLNMLNQTWLWLKRLYICAWGAPQNYLGCIKSLQINGEKSKSLRSAPFNPLKILSELIGFFNKFFQFLLQNTLMDGLKDSVQWMRFSKFYLGSELTGMPWSHMGNFIEYKYWSRLEKVADNWYWKRDKLTKLNPRMRLKMWRCEKQGRIAMCVHSDMFLELQYSHCIDLQKLHRICDMGWVSWVSWVTFSCIETVVTFQSDYSFKKQRLQDALSLLELLSELVMVDFESGQHHKHNHQ